MGLEDSSAIESFLQGSARTQREDLSELAYVTLGISVDLEGAELIQRVEAPVLEWPPVEAGMAASGSPYPAT